MPKFKARKEPEAKSYFAFMRASGTPWGAKSDEIVSLHRVIDAGSGATRSSVYTEMRDSLRMRFGHNGAPGDVDVVEFRIVPNELP